VSSDTLEGGEYAERKERGKKHRKEIGEEENAHMPCTADEETRLVATSGGRSREKFEVQCGGRAERWVTSPRESKEGALVGETGRAERKKGKKWASSSEIREYAIALEGNRAEVNEKKA